MSASSPDLSPILADFQKSRAPASTLTPPAIPGLYAVFLKDASLPTPFLPGTDGILYLGTSPNLAERNFLQHFTTGATGTSTLRRSFGAILKSQLSLRAIPRAAEKIDANFKNFRFDDAGEQRLTDWLTNHLEIGYHASLDYQTLEAPLLLLLLRPLLNLKGWPNPHANALQTLRQACTTEARQSRS